MTSPFTFYFPKILPLTNLDQIVEKTNIIEASYKNNEKIIKTENNTNESITVQLKIHHTNIGKIIGVGGINIKNIRDESQADIKINKELVNYKRIISITGTKETVNLAKAKIRYYLHTETNKKTQ